ncbi:MAG: enoyl-CoA hydratase/isomerase family protein [Deinococcales bacterium]
MPELVLLERREQLALLTLNRPELRNALSKDLLLELQAHLSKLERDSRIRALVLTGAGGTFSSGADLASVHKLLSSSAEEQKRDSSLMATTLRQIYLYPKPIIAALEGAAVAGGAGLASACDLVVASEDCKFGYSEVRLGFVAAIVGVFLIRAVGEKHAKELLLTGKLFTAREAHRMGLVNRVVPKGNALQEALVLAAEISQNSSTALAATKELLSSLYGMGLNESFTFAATLNAWIRGTDDLREGVSAFLEKRKPNW